jgi:hypothetical protein
MFSDLYDSISTLLYRRWPTAAAEISAVRILGGRGRLLLEYRFSLGDDSFIGESACPAWAVGTAAVNVHEQFPVGRLVDSALSARQPER